MSGREVQIRWHRPETTVASVQIWEKDGRPDAPPIDAGSAVEDSVDNALASLQVDVGENLEPLYRECADLGVREFLLHGYYDETLWQVLGFRNENLDSGPSHSYRGKTAGEALRNAIAGEKQRRRRGEVWAIAGSLQHAKRILLHGLVEDDPFRQKIEEALRRLAETAKDAADATNREKVPGQ